MAVIDMGSNSFRLVVFQYELGSWWSLADEIREATRVSAGMGETGVLQPEPMDRALHTAAVFSSFLRVSGVECVDALATSAIRDAANRDELLDAIRERTGLEVRVIGDEQEAWYGYLAIANSLAFTDGFGIDLGGGSVQIMQIADRRLEEAASVRLGSVRVSEAFLEGEKSTGKQIKALRKHVSHTLSEFEWWGGCEGQRLAGIGGTIRNLATAAQKRLDLPDVDVQGFVLTRDVLEELIELLASKPVAKRGSVPGIKPDRGDVILGGALVLAAAMEHGGFDGVEVVEAGLREGVFFERLLSDRDPPLLRDVRRESVINLAHRFRTDDDHVEHVAQLSLQMFTALEDAGLHELGDWERELLWAACMLHDIGVAIGYDDHHRHSHYMILSAGLPGFDPRELALIALIARWHRKGDPDPSELGDLKRKGDGARLLLLCGVIRLAEQLERSRDGSIAAVEVDDREPCVILRPMTDGGPRSDPSVAIWSAQRNSDLLADAIGKPVEVVGPDSSVGCKPLS
ncbi:MAG TPA: Ppx/GppA phosphatase family protein [Solirubrobacteraceae bacterium]|nr:Ppx/GppA phosphatase family protein [Solirubrobacteraceae bacterium]